MSLLLDVPLLRQESFTTCWFAAGRMVKAYHLRDKEDRDAYLEIATRLQRWEGVFQHGQGDGQWLMAKLLQGRRFTNDAAIYRSLGVSSTLSADRRQMAVHKRRGGDAPDFGLNFYFDGELDKYCRAEGLERNSTCRFIRELVALADDEVVDTLKDRAFLYKQFYRLESELSARGPLMVSLKLLGSGISHAHVVTGVLKTASDHTFENTTDMMARSFRNETTTTAPHGYWVVLNDPSGSPKTIFEMSHDDSLSASQKEARGQVRAESYYVPLSQFMFQMILDHAPMQDSVKSGGLRAGEDCNPPSFVYDPRNVGQPKSRRVKRDLPDSCTDTGVAYTFAWWLS